MILPRKYCLPSILIVSAFFFACRSNATNSNINARTNTSDASANTNAGQVKDNIEELETMIKLPFHPKDVMWRDEPPGKQTGENRTASPNEKKLTCVLRFKTDEAAKIVEQALKHRPAQPTEMEAENWFPPELVAKSQESGNETIKGKTYAANDFYQSPFLDGKITRIEGTDFFILELFSK